MNNYFKTLIHSQGILFTIERNGVSVSQSLGLLNHEKSTGKAYIGMLEDFIRGWCGWNYIEF